MAAQPAQQPEDSKFQSDENRQQQAKANQSNQTGTGENKEKAANESTRAGEEAAANAATDYQASNGEPSRLSSSPSMSVNQPTDVAGSSRANYSETI